MHIKAVAASIYDIRNTDPQPEDEYFIDTNVWYWTTYTRASIPTEGQPRRYQTEQYPRFIKRALDKGAVLRRCNLSLAELSRIIEDCERTIFVEFVAGRDMSVKEYRHSEDEEREQVVTEIESSWGQVKGMSQCVPLIVQDETCASFLGALKEYRLDGYDLFLLQAMKQEQLKRVLTDDADFATVSGIEVFTSNPGLIELARQQGQLRRR